MLILNDIHIGVQRKGGTTPASQEALRNYLLDSLTRLLHDSDEDHLCIVGDLFDCFEVASRDWLAAYMILWNWVTKHKDLTLIAGNHDWSPKGERLSSFETLARVLSLQAPARVLAVGIDEWVPIGDGVIALAHCSNQQTFEEKLAEVLERAEPGNPVLLHANYDNNFAAQSDHSLNVSEETARRFAEKGATLVFAHEHQARWAGFLTPEFKELPGSVVVLGNQWPTSVSDCLRNDAKYAYVLKDGKLQATETWKRTGVAAFAEVDWHSLSTPPNIGFIRVVGEAAASEASDVVNAISRFRREAPPSVFVVTNAVAIDGIVQAEALPETFEVAKRFDVMDYIKKHLDPAEIEAVQGLLAQTEGATQ